MTPPKRGLTPDVLDDAVERHRRVDLFEVADLAYRRAGAKTDPDLDAWVNALPDGISR
jgi:hypothetical protein